MYKWLKKRCSRKTSRSPDYKKKTDLIPANSADLKDSIEHETPEYHVYAEIGDVIVDCLSLDSGINPLYEEFSETDSLCHDCPLCRSSRDSSSDCDTSEPESDLVTEMNSMWDIYSCTILNSNVRKDANIKNRQETLSQRRCFARTGSYMRKRPLPPIPRESKRRIKYHNDSSGFFEQ